MEQRETIIVLDYGSQYTQLIARRVREQHVYCHIYPWNAAPERVLAHKPMGLILSGGPNSVYEPGAPSLPRYITQAGVPILGKSLNGMDSLFAVAQMPPGVPVACMAVDGAKNAGLYAARIISLIDQE